MKYEEGKTVLGGWTIEKELGEGGYGKVYALKKEDFGITIRSALKVMRIPTSQAEVRSALSEGMDPDSVTTMYKQIVDDLVKEIAILSSLKSHPNIVRYEDHKVEKQEDGIGWDILIRMELLMPLNDYLLKHAMPESEVARLGRELGSAIAFCEEKGLIHRDIKPENTFVDELGHFKLGDFGIARTAEKTTGTMSQKGTPPYMAPEVFLGKPYGRTVDIYSLGMMMYKLLNHGRLPFYPLDKKVISYDDRQEAQSRRLRGEAFPRPTDASEKIASVIMKACAYNAKDRYQTGREFLQALEAAENGSVSGPEYKKAFSDAVAGGGSANAPGKDVSEDKTDPIGFGNKWQKEVSDDRDSPEDGTSPIGKRWQEEKKNYQVPKRPQKEARPSGNVNKPGDKRSPEQAAPPREPASPQKKPAVKDAKAAQKARKWITLTCILSIACAFGNMALYACKLIRITCGIKTATLFECIVASGEDRGFASMDQDYVSKIHFNDLTALAVIAGIIIFWYLLIHKKTNTRIPLGILSIFGSFAYLTERDTARVLILMDEASGLDADRFSTFAAFVAGITFLLSFGIFFWGRTYLGNTPANLSGKRE